MALLTGEQYYDAEDDDASDLANMAKSTREAGMNIKRNKNPFQIYVSVRYKEI